MFTIDFTALHPHFQKKYSPRNPKIHTKLIAVGPVASHKLFLGSLCSKSDWTELLLAYTLAWKLASSLKTILIANKLFTPICHCTRLLEKSNRCKRWWIDLCYDRDVSKRLTTCFQETVTTATYSVRVSSFHNLQWRVHDNYHNKN